MRVTILWAWLAAYTCAFFRELAGRGCRLQLVYQPMDDEAPYQGFDLSFCVEAMEDSGQVKDRLAPLVSGFRPDCILMSSWCFPHFMKVAKAARRKGVYVVSAMDNQWRGTLRQHGGVLCSRAFLKPCIDTFFVPGDRQAHFARKLGYERVIYGACAADIRRFAGTMPIKERPRKFLYIGRLLPIKGVEELAGAYAAYRKKVTDPWGLMVAGKGPLDRLFQGMEGVDAHGFVQPEDVPGLMNGARCLVLPSRFEQWGVVIQEATAAGLPVIATDACGATTTFVRDGINGYIVPVSRECLSQAMVRMADADGGKLEEMSAASSALGRMVDPRTVAGYFLDSVALMKSRTPR